VARHLDDGAAVDAAAGEYVDDFAPAVVGGNAAVLVSTPGGGPAATGCRRGQPTAVSPAETWTTTAHVPPAVVAVVASVLSAATTVVARL